MTTRTCFFIFAAGLALVAVTNAETTPEESFSEATAFVQSFAAEGGDSSACAKVADDSIREVESECTTLQNEVDRRAKGDQVCCAAGKKAACHAKWRMDKAGNLVKNCKKAVKDAAAAKITGQVTLEQLKGKSSCLSTIKDNSNYAQVASALKKEKRECEKKKGAKKSYKKSYDDFVTDSDKQRKKCHNKSVKSAKEAFKKAKKACESDANKKAYARAMHMKCILAGGTSLKDCKKVKNPTLKETKMTAVKGYCKHVSMNCPAPTPAPTPKPTTGAPTSTPTPKPTPNVLKNTCKPMGNGFTCWQPGAPMTQQTYPKAYCTGTRCSNSRSISASVFKKTSGGTNPTKDALHAHPACRGVTGDRSGSNLNFLYAADRPLCCALICSQSHICKGVDTTDFRSDKCTGQWDQADRGCVFLTGSYDTGGCGVTPHAQSRPLQRKMWNGRYKDGSYGKSKWIKEYNGKGIMNSEKLQCGGKVPGCGYKLDQISGLLQCNGP